ncbi:MAG TPA: alkaline phosphatase family protein [Rhizomicrobium sp.]|nr:alkaline phosphatase family protein [Rhizomicrobium sp.]
MTVLARRVTGLGLACWVGAAASFAAPPARLVPHYDHIFVIVEENRGFNEIMDHPDWTPVIHRLAKTYGLATQFYAEVHSSEGNYIAMLGGDTFGIHDDDAFFCKPGPKIKFCEKSEAPNYVDHDITARSLMDQMAKKGLTWKAYMEDIPFAGALVPRWPSADYPAKGVPDGAYAAKHNGFVSFRNVNQEPYPQRMEHLVGFGQLDADLASGTLPNYAHIVPNQCNEMHGMGKGDGPDVPPDCLGSNEGALIKRGDTEIGVLVDKIMQSKLWSAAGNFAIVVTFDENNDGERKSGVQGCCGYDPKSVANFGGGRIPTIVITNHGPRGLVDPTPYNHYSFLRTVEDAFGISEHLGHAADTDKGVVSMAPLFAVR